jgi:chitinase
MMGSTDTDEGVHTVGRFDGRRLSWFRLTVLVGGVAALVFVGLSGWRWFQDTQAAADDTAWFAGYVDATVTPQLAFEEPPSKAARNVILSFVVAAPSRPCQPSWGGAYTMDEAASDLDLDRRVARLRQQQGSLVVSFGGQANTELSAACDDPEKLLEAYRDVVTRYDLRTLDLDIEGEALDDEAANLRRATAMRVLQDERRAEDADLRVWLTLPASPQGLSESGQQAVTAMLEAGVKLSGVNVMTMDYGASREEGQSMLEASVAALEATHDQLGVLHARADQPLGPATRWKRMGATPMIGQNDVAGEIFDLDDARALNAFAKDKGLGRLSMWSLNRDRTCGVNYPDVRVVSSSCSGVDQGDLTFADVLRRGVTGHPDTATVAPVAQEGRATADPTDDPEASPYPVWADDEAYVEGARVVWHRNAYVAEYWTQGDVPDDPVVQEVESPWRLLGPVLPGETPVPVPELPDDTYPQWRDDEVYTKGDRVLVDGTAFTAKWWTQGDNPAAPSTLDDPSPWAPLTDAELRRVLASLDDED